MHPARDEFPVRPFAPQRAFPRRERAHVAEQGFHDHEADGREVQAAEPGIAREGEPQREADPGRCQSPDDEDDERCVDDEDRVGERGAAQSALASAGAFAAAGTGTWKAIVMLARRANSAGCVFTSG